MQRITKNLLANFVSYAWMPLVMLAAWPVYEKLLEMEAIGLLGLFLIFQSFVVVLDAGLSMTLSRELARLSLEENAAGQMRDLLRTLEVVFWIVAVVIGVAVASLGTTVAHFRVNPEQYPAGALAQAVALMGLTLFAQWPLSLYRGGLMGLQHQVSLAVINVIMFTVRFVGVIFALRLIETTVECFFLYQAAAAAVHTLIAGCWIWRKMPPSASRAAFRWQLLRKVRYFAIGISGITVTALLLTQMDKILLFPALKLEEFGQYSTAGAVAMGLFYLFAPIAVALQPRFTQLIRLTQWKELSHLYHLGCQLGSAIVLPPAVLLMLFPREILALWMRDAVLGEQTWLVLTFLVAGATLNGLACLPYALQLAYGWTKLVLITNMAALVVMAPAMIVLLELYGPAGIAAAWIIPHAAYVLITIPLMHRRLLRKEMWRWYGRDVALPLLAVLVVAFLGWTVVPRGASSAVLLLSLLATALACFLAALAAGSEIRAWLGRLLAQRRRPPEPSE